MITATAKGTFYRMHTPCWASSPTSGAGAALQGGRANRKGVEALYLSTEYETAIDEYRQVSSLLTPGTLVSYDVEIAEVADFRKGFDPAAGWAPIWEDFYCDWRRLAIVEKLEPPSWVVSDLVLQAGLKGILFPSVARPGGFNLVVYPSALTPGDKLAAIDPRGDLPKDQASWTAR
jgi:RES domain-containing protein